jgi:UDP-N-acetyl-D-mannosaminuronic acid dehydrogenase
MKITVVGMGYIGLPTAVTIASAGLPVYGYDIQEERINDILNGKIKIVEEGLNEKLAEVLGRGLLRVGTKLENGSDVYLIVVSTSLQEERNEIDLNALRNASEKVGKVLEKGNLVIVESTVVPGTTENVVRPILEKTSGLVCSRDFYLVFSPERVLPGNLMYELIHNDRIIGGVCPRSAEMARDFYAKFVKGRLHLTNVRTAEMAKLMENTYRTVNIALANELALIAEKYGVNVYEAIRLANTHPRVHLHQPGPGVGGYCLTKDPWFLIQNFKHSRIIKDAMEINAWMPEHVVELAEEALVKVGKTLKNAKVCILGLAYKGNVSDARESPGYEIYLKLRMKGAEVTIHDPFVLEYMGYYPVRDLYEAVRNADAVIIATEHNFYRTLDWERIKTLMNSEPVVIDTRNLTPDAIEGIHLRKLGVGK